MVIIIFCNFACSQECVAHSRTFTGQTCWLWLGQETPTWVDRGRTQTSWYQRICFPWGKNWYFPLCRNVHGANFFSRLFVHFGVVFLEKAIRGFQKFCMEADPKIFTKSEKLFSKSEKIFQIVMYFGNHCKSCLLSASIVLSTGIWIFFSVFLYVCFFFLIKLSLLLLLLEMIWNELFFMITAGHSI